MGYSFWIDWISSDQAKLSEPVCRMTTHWSWKFLRGPLCCRTSHAVLRVECTCSTCFRTKYEHSGCSPPCPSLLLILSNPISIHHWPHRQLHSLACFSQWFSPVAWRDLRKQLCLIPSPKKLVNWCRAGPKPESCGGSLCGSSVHWNWELGLWPSSEGGCTGAAESRCWAAADPHVLAVAPC
jgi:hypothetical protein